MKKSLRLKPFLKNASFVEKYVHVHTNLFSAQIVSRSDQISYTSSGSLGLICAPISYWNFQPQYLIKYKGYDDSENTWEPIENLNCKRLIKRFEQKIQKNVKTSDTNVSEYSAFDKIVAKRTIANNKVCILYVELSAWE